MIKLTRTNNKPVYINPNFITSICETNYTYEYPRPKGASTTVNCNGNVFFSVLESPETIVKMIENKSIEYAEENSNKDQFKSIKEQNIKNINAYLIAYQNAQEVYQNTLKSLLNENEKFSY